MYSKRHGRAGALAAARPHRRPPLPGHLCSVSSDLASPLPRSAPHHAHPLCAPRAEALLQARDMWPDPVPGPNNVGVLFKPVFHVWGVYEAVRRGRAGARSGQPKRAPGPAAEAAAAAAKGALRASSTPLHTACAPATRRTRRSSCRPPGRSSPPPLAPACQGLDGAAYAGEDANQGGGVHFFDQYWIRQYGAPGRADVPL